MSRKPTEEQRRKHRRIEEEFQARRLTIGEIGKAESISLDAFRVLQDVILALRKKRVEEGLSLEDVAKASGIDKAHLSRLENGKVLNPTFETLYRYASAIRPIRSLRDLAAV